VNSSHGLKEIVTITALGNVAFMPVMERLGMTRSIKFDYPNHPEGSPLRRHVLYRLPRSGQNLVCRPTVFPLSTPSRH